MSPTTVARPFRVNAAPISGNDPVDSVRRIVHDGSLKPIGINEAKTIFSRLLRRVAVGEEIIIARGSTPVARLVAVESPNVRGLGVDSGRFTMPFHFDHPIESDGTEAFDL